MLSRNPATFSRELRRNLDSRQPGSYRPFTAQRLAVERRARPGRGKLMWPFPPDTSTAVLSPRCSRSACRMVAVSARAGIGDQHAARHDATRPRSTTNPAHRYPVVTWYRPSGWVITASQGCRR
jgi:hypothetical protein